MPFAANFTQYNNETYFGAGRQAANDYEAALRAGERWAWALDADPAAPEATLKFEQRATTAARAPFNHSGWPVAVSARAATRQLGGREGLGRESARESGVRGRSRRALWRGRDCDARAARRHRPSDGHAAARVP